LESAALLTGAALSLLAPRTHPKKLKPVCHFCVSVLGGDPRFQLLGKAFLNFHYVRTARADQVMVVPVIPFSQKFKPRRPFTEIEALYYAHPLKQVN